MQIKIQEFTMRHWQQPKIEYYRDRGDFYDGQQLIPSLNGRQMRRTPGWSAYTAITGADDVEAAFYDQANDQIVFLCIVSGTPDKLHAFYNDGAWHNNDITAGGITGLGGLDNQNVLWHHGYLYLIGDDQDVYRSTNYTSSLSSLYTGSDARILCIHNERVYMITDDGDIYQLNDANTAFEVLLAPVGTLDIRFATSFKGYLLLVNRGQDGSLWMFRFTDNLNLVTVGHIQHVTGDLSDGGCPFLVYQDELWFTGGQIIQPDASLSMNLYTFNGSQIKQVAYVDNTPATTDYIGLVEWQGYLIIYTNAKDGASSRQIFQMLVGDCVVEVADDAHGATNVEPLVFSLDDALIMLGDSAGVSVGWYQIDGSQDLEDAELWTSWMDFGAPAREKMLNRIVVMLNSRASSFLVPVYYRVNDNTSWTLATTGDNTKRVEADNIKVPFYTLQLKILLDDDTGSDEDIRIEAVSILYSVSD